MRFYIGQRVICVDDSPTPEEIYITGETNLDGLQEGNIYTIRGNIIFDKEQYGVYLYEIKRLVCPNRKIECPYYSWRFNPFEEKKTDISVFTKLTRKKQKVLENVE